jgi:DNA-directed RNA polymerase specialized sigma24 family protein
LAQEQLGEENEMAAIPGDVDLTGCSLERSEDLEHPAEKLRNGKETAFREFVERYQARIYHVALAILGTPEQADEIARKAFVDAHPAFNGITSDSSLFIRTHRITVDECYRFLAGSWFVPLRSHRGTERRDLLNKLLVRIPREDRHILLLCEMEGYSTANISELLGLNEDAVRTILFRTRQRLADALRREGGKRRRLLRITKGDALEIPGRRSRKAERAGG